MDSGQRIISAASVGTSAPLMLEIIAVLWQNVQRNLLETEQNWTLKVSGTEALNHWTRRWHWTSFPFTIVNIDLFISVDNVSGSSVGSQTATGVIVLLCAVLALSLIVMALLIYAIKRECCSDYRSQSYFSVQHLNVVMLPICFCFMVQPMVPCMNTVMVKKVNR